MYKCCSCTIFELGLVSVVVYVHSWCRSHCVGNNSTSTGCVCVCVSDDSSLCVVVVVE